MIYYPIKEDFYEFFKGKEEVLENLIHKNSTQLLYILEKIDKYDFYHTCSAFYESDNYTISDEKIIYENPVSCIHSECLVYQDYFYFTSMIGFEMLFQRYYPYYFCIDEKENSYWYSFYFEKKAY